MLRIVSNLLDNAIKYSPPGSTIDAETRDEGALVALAVHDEGPGIAEQDLGRVFERFYKGEASRSSAGVGPRAGDRQAPGASARRHGHGREPAGRRPTFTVRLPRKFVGRNRREW